MKINTERKNWKNWNQETVVGKGDGWWEDTRRCSIVAFLCRPELMIRDAVIKPGLLIVIGMIISQNKDQMEVLNWRCDMDTIIVMSSEVGGAAREAWLTELWCLIEHSILKGKIHGQPTMELSKPFSQKKSRMNDQEVEDSFPSKKPWYLTQVAGQDSFLTRTQLTKGKARSQEEGPYSSAASI